MDLSAEIVVRGLTGEPEGGFRMSRETHLGTVPLCGIRQKKPSLAMTWKTASVPSVISGDCVTFAWTGATGDRYTVLGNFFIFVNGKLAAEFDVAVGGPTRYVSRAPGCDFVYDVLWFSPSYLDTSGHFYLTVPARWVEPGEPAEIEVKSNDRNWNAWFAVIAGHDAPMAVPSREWEPFAPRTKPALPPPDGSEASYEWYLRQHPDWGVFTTIGAPADPAHTAVSNRGQLMNANDKNIIGSSYIRNSLAFAVYDGVCVTPIGVGEPARQSLLNDCMPIVVTNWKHGDIELRQTSYGEPLDGRPYETGTESTLAWAAVEVINRASEPREFTLLASYIGDENDLRREMTHHAGVIFENGSAVFSVQASDGFSIEFTPVFPADADTREALDLLKSGKILFNVLAVRGEIGAGQRTRVIFNRVFPFPGTYYLPASQLRVSPEQLTGRSFDEGLRSLEAAWRSLAGGVSRFKTPEPVLNRILVKGMLDGYQLTKRWDSRYVVFDSVCYQCQWDDASTKWFYALDLMGDHETAEKLLDTVFERQGNRKPTGTRTHEGCFSDVTNTLRDGSSASWTSCNGWALWSTAQHARMTNDRDWLENYKSKILEGCGWIIRERSFSKEEPGNSCRGLIYGKFVCDMADDGDVSGVGYFVYNDAISYMGLHHTGLLLKEWGHPEGEALLAEAESYRQNIIAAVDRLTDKSRNPWYIPFMLHAPKHEDCYLYDACGPINLAHGGVLPCDDIRISHIIRWIIDHVHGGSVEAAAAGVTAPYEGAMFYSQDLAITLLELGRVEEFLRIFYTLLAGNVSHQTLTTCERGPNTLPHIHSISSIVRMLRTMLIHERDGALCLLQGTPRRWFEQGEEIVIRDAPTWYGPLSLRCKSDIANDFVRISLSAPERICTVPIILKLRLPDGLLISGAESTGGETHRIDGESLVLSGLKGAADVRVHTTAIVE